MADNLQQFNMEIDNFTKKMLPAEVVIFHKKIVLQALRGIVYKNPVRTGRSRGNWQVTIGSPATGQLDITDKDGRATIAKGLAAIQHLPPYQIVWISNNVDYIEDLEAGTASPKQAPHGMVEVTVAELRMMFKGAA